MTEWLKLMLEEIARKQAERDSGLAEAARRAAEQQPSRSAQPATPARVAKHVKAAKS